ncbi:MAG: hypothetical protein CBC92_000815 [Euryarchaeota archaeon TMED132]|nr:hypothetical protein [Euryarchaeota archaeon]RAH07880.1 MAG: hypothetical protein CBC92_000815 [Euryarchaeota archaeon TMED132]
MKGKNEENNSKNSEDRGSEWFVKNGYKKPEDMIDYDSELDKPKAFFGIFTAYNQHNIAEGRPWDNWPDWELCLTSMDSDLHFKDPERDDSEKIAAREHWLTVSQFIYENKAISIDEYTISIAGRNGNTFSLDFCLEIECWGTPGTYADHKKSLEANAKKPKPWMWSRQLYPFEHQIGHSLGPWWTCPEYIPEYGGETTIHTPDSSFCVSGVGDTFPSTLLSALKLCIDDYKIWIIQYREAKSTAEYIQKIEREYPSGRPEDYYYL